MKAEQFDVLVKLMRGTPSSEANKAAREVLVNKTPVITVVKGVSIARASVYQAVERYQTVHVDMINAFQDSYEVGPRFDLICKLTRGKSDAPSTVGARAYLVDRKELADIEVSGITKAALWNAIYRYQELLATVEEVYPIPPKPKTTRKASQ